MNQSIRTAVLLAMGLAWGPLSYAEANAASAPVAWASTEGMARLAQSDNKHDLFELAPQFEGQANKVDCGVASAVIVLNALRVNKPSATIAPDTTTLTQEDQRYLPHRPNWSPFWLRYTQNMLMSAGPKSRAEMLGQSAVPGGLSRYGLTLSEEAALLEQQGVQAAVEHVSTVSGSARVRQQRMIIDALAASETYVIVNISRAAMGQQGGGHISPLVAYDAASDSFLMMDVSNTAHSWVWVDSDALFAGLNTIDNDSGRYRGFLIVTEKAVVSSPSKTLP